MMLLVWFESRADKTRMSAVVTGHVKKSSISTLDLYYTGASKIDD